MKSLCNIVIITVPADDLASDGARSSAGIVMPTRRHYWRQSWHHNYSPFSVNTNYKYILTTMIMILMISTVKMIYTKLKIFWMKYYIIASYLVCRCVTFENPSVIQSAAGFTLPQVQVKCICLHMRWIYIWHNMMVIFLRVHSPSPVVWGVNPLAVTTWTSKLVPYSLIKSLRLIWRSGTHRFHLRVPQMCSRSEYSVEESWRLRNQFILFVIFFRFFHH